MTTEGSMRNLQVRNVFDLTTLSEEDVAELTEAFNTIDRIAKKQGSMCFVPTGYRLISERDKLRPDLTVILGWEAHKSCVVA